MDKIPLRDQFVANLFVLVFLAGCVLLRGIEESRRSRAAAHPQCASDLPRLAQGPAK